VRLSEGNFDSDGASAVVPKRGDTKGKSKEEEGKKSRN
jgi:hypothetical protein